MGSPFESSNFPTNDEGNLRPHRTRNLPEYPNPRHRSTMESSLVTLAAALLAARAPWWIVGAVILGVFARYIVPIRLNLTIGERFRRGKTSD